MLDSVNWGAILISILFLLIGLALVWIAGWLNKGIEGAAIIGLLLIPFVAYLVYSDKLESFAGGGIELRMRQAAAQPVIFARTQDEVQIATSEMTAATAEDLSREAILGRPVHVVLLNVTEWENVTPETRLIRTLHVGTVIYSSFLAGTFLAMVVLDENNRPVGVLEGSYFLDLLRIPFNLYSVAAGDRERAATVSDLRAMIQQTELWALLRAPETRAQMDANKAFIPESMTQLAALQTMSSERWEAAAITDATGRYQGTVSKKAIMEALTVNALSAAANN